MSRLQELGELYREFREDRDMTVFDVAREGEIEAAAIVLFEDGIEMPDNLTLQRMCDSICITTGLLFDC